MTDPRGHTTTNTYDPNGNLLTVTSPSPDGSTAGSLTQFATTTKGESTTITDPLNHVTYVAYSPPGSSKPSPTPKATSPPTATTRAATHHRHRRQP